MVVIVRVFGREGGFYVVVVGVEEGLGLCRWFFLFWSPQFSLRFYNSFCSVLRKGYFVKATYLSNTDAGVVMYSY